MPPERDAYEVLQVHPKARQAIIDAAYRILAREHHPDRDASSAATRRMAELNLAYERVRTPDRRELYDKRRALAQRTSPTIAAYPTPPPRPADDTANDVLDFGRYEGWTLEQLAAQDPDYLRWLSRSSAGLRFRGRIEQLLARRDAAKAREAERKRGPTEFR